MRLTPPQAAWLSSAVIFVVSDGATGQVTLPGIVHQWSAEGTADDAVGDAHGVLTGAVGYTEGWCGQSFLFDGGYIDFGNEVGNFGMSDFTVAFWIRTSYPPKHSIIGKRINCWPGSFWEIRVWPDSTGTIASIGGNEVIAAGSVSDNLWHHFLFQREGDLVSVFIDGGAAGSAVGLTEIDNYAPLIAGHSTCEQIDGTVPLIGELDEIQIYHRALTIDEIQMLADPDQICLPCPGDTDGDGEVAVADLLLVLAQWGACPPDCPGDANLDGTVDVTDLLLVLGNWGPCPPPGK